jgi:glucose-1-phosphate thymidylyltransferase
VSGALPRRKGIVLAGGAGTRLHPLTRAVSKQLLPVYDKPMVYYPLCTLMEAGLREVLVIATPEDAPRFEALLGDGSAWGMAIRHAVQARPEGIAQALTLARAFLAGAPSCLVLGDNLFHGAGFAERVRAAAERTAGATVFGCRVSRPERYGVAQLAADGRLERVVEKPARPPSPWAVTGLYLYDAHAPELVSQIRPSARGQLEITDLNNAYLARGELGFERLDDGVAWLDMGTPDTLLEAGELVRAVEQRSSAKVGCPEEVAFRRGWIDAQHLARLARGHGETAYGAHLRALAAGGGSA